MARKNRKKQPSQNQKNQQKNNQSYSPSDAEYINAAQEAKSLIKNVDRKIIKSVPKGIRYDWFSNTSFNNIVYPRDKIPDRLLRLIERRNGIVGAVVTLRIQQAVEFSDISYDNDIPGWEFVLIDEKETMTPEREKQKDFLENFMKYGQRADYEEIDGNPSDMRDRLTKYIRDRLLIDKITWEIERDKKNRALALWVLDGATIVPVLPGGYYGSTSQIGVGFTGGYTKLSEEIRKVRIDNIPPLNEIAYVQELFYGSTTGGGIAAAFRETDLLYDLANELNDIRYYKQGFSVTEKANISVVAFINALTFNSNGLSRGAIPKIAVAMGKDSGYTIDQLEDAQDEWAANFEAMDGQWNIPLLNGDAKILNLLPNNRDMEYQKFMEFVAALTCSEMGADPAELGLRLNQAQSVLSENQDAKQLFSKNRGLRDLLGGFIYIINKFLRNSGWDFAKDWKFKFNGLEVEDKGFLADLRKKAVETDKTINELRAENDDPPDPYGDIICNPQYIQYRMQKEQMESGMGGEAEAGNQEEEYSDEDYDNMADEAMAGLKKAVRLI